MFKNVAAKFMVFAFDATTNVPKTGDAANITAYVSKDYGTVTVLADTSATEMDATNAPGYYLFDAAQGETNADCLMVSGKSATSNIKVIGAPSVIYTRPTTGWLAPATAGRTLVVDAAGLADANMVKAGPTGSGTAITARDIGASVLLSSGSGTGQLDFTSGVVKANATQWVGGTIPAVNITGVPLVDAKYLLGTIFPTPTVAGIPNVNAKTWNDLTTVALPLVPTTAGRTLDVSTGGEAGIDWANIGTPGSTVNLSATTTNVVNTLTTYTGNTVQTGDAFARLGVAGVGLTNLGDTRIANLDAAITTRMATYTQPTGFLAATFPSGMIANTTNTTAGTMTTVTNVTNAPTAGDFTATMKSSIKTQVVDSLATDTYAEPTGAPAATATLAAKINRIYQALRNRVDVSATDKTFYNDAGSALWSKGLSDDGTTYTENEGA